MSTSPRPVLDPSGVEHVTGDASINILPKVVRDFGYAPAVEQFLPGDLLLFRPVGQSFLSRHITTAQERAGFGVRDAQWTHAAVFLYDDIMVEAVPWGGVRQASVYGRVPAHCILVRRNPALEERIRYKIALRALGMIGKRYSYRGVLSLGWDLLRGLWTDNNLAANRQIVICSQVFADAHGEMADQRLDGCPYVGATTPAHLSATADLVDVVIGWKKLV